MCEFGTLYVPMRLVRMPMKTKKKLTKKILVSSQYKPEKTIITRLGDLMKLQNFNYLIKIPGNYREAVLSKKYTLVESG